MRGRAQAHDCRAALVRAIGVRLALIAIFVLAAGQAAADEISGWVELIGGVREDEGDVRTDSFAQAFNLNFDKRLYPNLTFRLGGVFERIATSVERPATETDTTTLRLRPYFEILLRNQFYLAELRYNRNEERSEFSGLSSPTQVQESWIATLDWFPVELPRVKFQFGRQNNFDKGRSFQDITEDRFELTAHYNPVSKLQLRYRWRLSDFTNRLENNEARRTSHFGRITYADRWWNQRVTFSADLNLSHENTEAAANVSGEVNVPVVPLAGLSAIDETPAEGALGNNPALIDGNVEAGAGINLGLPASGGNAEPRNMGLSFGGDQEINDLFVWVDRDLPAEIASSFAWQIYTSDDNEEWLLTQIVAPAGFDSFQKRFEIRPADKLTARFVKVVTSPLTSGVPGATEYPVILVTEMQATSDVTGEQNETSHITNLGLRVRILDVPSLYYELTYFLTKPGPNPSRYTISNGLFLTHSFNEVYSLVSRVAREDSQIRDTVEVAYVYSASLEAAAISTLRHRLVFSGRSESVDDVGADTNSILLFNEARLYPGINLNLSLGKVFRTSSERQRTETSLINLTTSLVPHRTTTITLAFRDDTSDTTGGGAPDTSFFTRSATFAVAYNPLRALYLFASSREEWRPSVPRRTTISWSVNWSPFPDGTLRLNLNYNENIRSEDDSRTRTLVPSLRWNINERTFLNVTYQRLTRVGSFGEAVTKILSGTLRFSF